VVAAVQRWQRFPSVHDWQVPVASLAATAALAATAPFLATAAAAATASVV